MNERISILRDQMRNGEHARFRMIMPDSWSTVECGGALIVRKAKALQLVVDRMPVFILPHELLVGSKTVFGKTIRENQTETQHTLNQCCYPHYATEEEKCALTGGEGFAKNHCLPAYRFALERGLDGMRGDILARKEYAGTTKAQTDYLDASLIVLNSISLMAKRYCALAEKMRDKEQNPGRREELDKIAHVCGKIAGGVPETLWEAMQLYLFVYFTLIIEQGISVGFGRIDQMFSPFVGNVLTEEEDELVKLFLIKLNDVGDLDFGDVHYNGEDSMVLAGVKRDGSDATNVLTYAFLRSFGELKLSGPMPCVRIALSTPDDVLVESCRLNIMGLNSAALYNDETFTKALHAAGFPLEDARNWGLDLCQDLQIEGASEFFYTGAISLWDGIEETLKNSPDDISWEEFYGRCVENTNGRIADLLEYYKACEELYYEFPEHPNQVLPAIKELLSKPVEGTSAGWMVQLVSPEPALSTFMEGCLEKARDASLGGCKYRNKGSFGLYPTNAANSLAAIHHTVFVTKELTLSEVRRAVECNYEGMEDVRLRLLNAPKWGNDDDRADRIVVQYIHDTEREIARHCLKSGEVFLSGVHQPHTQAAGKNLGTTADGRFAKAPVPVTLSPTNGTDRNGPTAALNSFAKLDSMLQQWNAAFTLAFDISNEDREEKAHTLAMLIRGYFDKGGTQLQPNVISEGELLDAQIHPEDHRDLLVRVWGVSMYFVELSREWQDEIVMRTRHHI